MVQVAIADLPTTQFTVGPIAKAKGCTLKEAREALDKLVEQGTLTVKVAGSGARNYKLKRTAAAKKAPAKKTATKKRTAAKKAAPSKTSATQRDAAKKEHAALKAWEASGGEGPRPSTENYDAITAKSAQSFGGRKTAKKAAGESTPRGTTVRFVVDGKPMPDSQNKLASVAYQHTAGVLNDRHGESRKRITVSELREILANVKPPVKDPANEVGWEVELANGKTIGTVAL